MADSPLLLAEVEMLREAIENRNEDLRKIGNLCAQGLIWPNMCANAVFNHEIFEEIEKIAKPN